MAYIVKRILTMVPVLFILSLMVFSFLHLIPGDPAQVILGQDASASTLVALRHQLGLDQPLPEQYWHWLEHTLQGNLGNSIVNGLPVLTLIGQRLPVTLELAIGTFIVALVVALPLGILAAVYRGKIGDAVSLFTSSLGIAVPPFWLGLMLLLLFTVRVHLLPSSGYVPFWQDPLQNLKSMALPIIATGVREAAVLMRMLRSTLIDVMDQDFVRTARAKGLKGWVVMYRHALRNALIPVITTGGLQVAGLLGGLVITETIFSLPGFGNLLVQSVFSRDFTTVQGAALVAALAVVLVNLLVDILYGIADPRIRLGKEAS
jgi:peptide/nickel transport system permease protein